MAIRSWREQQPSHEQLPMFMSAREIDASHQGLDGDRQETEDLDNPNLEHYPVDHPYSVRMNRLEAGVSHTSQWGAFAGPRRSTSAGSSDPPGTQTAMDMMRQKVRDQGPGVSDIRTQNGGRVVEGDAWRTETMDEMWDRKTDEAMDDFGHGPNGNMSLYESVAEHGVQKPISLSTNYKGSEGKNQIVGGHHRLAVQRAENPDVLNPVLFFKNIREAQDPDGSYRYT